MNQKKIEELIYSYSFMQREVIRLEGIYFRVSDSGRSWGVAQYGIEAAMPKGSSIRSAVEIDAMDKREQRMWNRIQAYEAKIELLDAAYDLLEDDMQKVIFDCMTDGMSYRSIAEHIGVSRHVIREKKDEMIQLFIESGHFDQNDQ
ncbi:hypothetical protein SporoP37_00380 [Sporosarcina sp. P37]|uniref:hypothetical protein n=1 Tax=unclassified Sporosarcina TaxID=2647733 RepID=UPI000A17EBC7|nr:MULTISPECIES: hypothetical protein [unclassified Sporosarcina]ARK23296.1 hypothetical protein SporoP37_00380 [Sporosarcina sp. P37]PID19548.1 hypothetical protein CSV62_03330 [Sporosarcina sp. P35]